MSKPGSASCSAREARARLVQNSSPSVHLLKAKPMSKADASAGFQHLAIASSVKPLALQARWLMPGASFSVPWPTA